MSEKINSANKRKIPCDYNKLRKAIEKRGLTPREASIEMGYADSMLCVSKVGDKITAPLAKLLEMCFNIRPEEYAPDEKVGDVQETHKKVEREIRQPDYKAAFDEVKDELYKVMYAAVYEAVKKAWSE